MPNAIASGKILICVASVAHEPTSRNEHGLATSRCFPNEAPSRGRSLPNAGSLLPRWRFDLEVELVSVLEVCW